MASNTTEEASQLLGQLVKSFNAAKPNIPACKKLITQLKILLTKFQLIPPFAGPITETKKQLLIARETLELATLVSIADKDEASFERHVAQVKTYYTDYGHLLPASERQWPILGMNLLFLLSHYRMGDFHTQLELIPLASQDNLHISFPVRLEQHLMEGTYNKVLNARNDVPNANFTFFMDTLATTVRDKMADCSERSYETLPLSQVPEMLMMSADDLTAYIADHDKPWTIKDGYLHFNQPVPTTEIPSFRLIRETLTYATELERIV
jgi:26S proteasome regulatory subunit N12